LKPWCKGEKVSGKTGTGIREVYFDDFTVTQIKSPVVQQEDFYAFGATASSYSRENATPNRYKFESKEYQEDLGLNLYDFGARQYDPLTGRFLSIDPKADKMRRFSPYVFGFDNPIRFIDPDGMAPNDVVLGGPEKQKALTELQASVQGKLNLSMDASGKVSYTQVQGAKLDKNSKQLVAAVDDHSVVVNVNATNNKTDSKGRLSIGGSFEGNTVTKNPDGTKSVTAKQDINPNVLGAADAYYGKPGANTLHEVTEAYQGAKISQASGVSSGDASTTGSVYSQAHSAATNQAGPIYETAFDAQGNKLPGGVYTGAVRAEYTVQKGVKAPLVIMSIP
jgi:RHS repeat-associated protein